MEIIYPLNYQMLQQYICDGSETPISSSLKNRNDPKFANATHDGNSTGITKVISATPINFFNLWTCF